ncbi:MAG: hypothetical protein JWO36_6043 [Myxococcales bacterium]|nr:hypothetical protein [Myxococcales bacterium]
MRFRYLLFLALASCAATLETNDAVDEEADAEDPGQADAIAVMIQDQADGPVVAEKSVDLDGDGIPDTVEEMLLRRYRPYYRFSKQDGDDEQYRPADPIAQLTNAQLRIAAKGGDGTSDPIAGCGRAGDHHLDPPDALYTCRTDTSLVTSPHKSNYALNLENARYHGVSFAEAQANATGLYGHVAPATINGHSAYKIEYWQFFAFNNQDISVLGMGSFGDHEGDWTSVQLWFDRELHRLVEARYLVHAKAITFTIPSLTPSCRNCTINVKGPNYDPDPPNFFDKPEAYSDNQAQFFIDDQHFKHVVVYIENGAHEFWPGPWGHAHVNVGPLDVDLNPHNGSGPSYLVPETTRLYNMGEVEHPLTRAGRLIMWFNGFWGSTNTKELVVFGKQRRSPVGPALHCSWTWPGRGPLPGCEH